MFEPDDEVEEMTMDELFNGKVCSQDLLPLPVTV